MRLLAALAFLLLGSVPALAQEADPIGALLEQAPTPSPNDEDAAEAAGVPTTPPAPEPTAGLPTGPIPYSSATAAPSHLSSPVLLDERGRTPDAPPSVRDLAYESRLRSSFASAQGFQGALDGSFILSGPDGDLYALELVDRSRGELEGAWRNLRVPGSGFLDDFQRTGGEVTLRFGAAVATLTGNPTGGWTGELVEAGRRQSVSLKRAPR